MSVCVSVLRLYFRYGKSGVYHMLTAVTAAAGTPAAGGADSGGVV